MLLDIINGLLDMSRIEAGNVEILPARYNAASLINNTVHLNILRIKNKPIEFKLLVDPSMPDELYGDELRIKQIVNNLLSNAFKFTNKGLVSMSFETLTMNTPGDDITLIIKVRDTGIGMTPEQVGELFDEYSRFNLESNRTQEGTGLGMSIAKRLVDIMDGEISVESIPNEGTEFTVRLPQKRIGLREIGPETAEGLSNFSYKLPYEKETLTIMEQMPYGSILLVDDIATNLVIAEGLLSPYKLKIDTATSGIEAVEKIKAGQVYDIVFMDHIMPEMDGLEATRLIREFGYARPVIALTANAMKEQVEIFLAGGFDDFISKPINRPRMDALLNKYIRDKQPPEILEALRHLKTEKTNGYSDDSSSTSSPPRLSDVFVWESTISAIILGLIHNKLNSYEEKDLETYIKNIRTIKAALANIGETELSRSAGKLEQAGLEKNYPLLISETPAFISALRKIIGERIPRANGEA
jgi:CheY-like chemotaxis protein/anti-sigma regulatory factor (Ser/Thr protein kinase)